MKPHEIKAALVLKQIKQSDIAKRLGVTRQTVNAVIAGRNKSKRVRRAIAKAIGRRDITRGEKDAA